MKKSILLVLIMFSWSVHALHYSQEYFLGRLDDIRERVLLAIHPENVTYIDAAYDALKNADYNEHILADISDALHQLFDTLQKDLNPCYKTDMDMAFAIKELADDMQLQSDKFVRMSPALPLISSESEDEMFFAMEHPCSPELEAR